MTDDGTNSGNSGDGTNLLYDDEIYVGKCNEK